MSAAPKMIELKFSDGETFEVEEAVALEYQTIKHMIEDDCADTSIPLPEVTSKILAKVIEYWKKHVDTPENDEKSAEEGLKAFFEFVKVDQGTLFDLILGTELVGMMSRSVLAVTNYIKQGLELVGTMSLAVLPVTYGKEQIVAAYTEASSETKSSLLLASGWRKMGMKAFKFVVFAFVITSFLAQAMPVVGAKPVPGEVLDNCNYGRDSTEACPSSMKLPSPTGN